MTTIEKTVSKEIEKWSKIKNKEFIRKDLIVLEYRNISLGDYDYKKKSFINLHYLKMCLHYFYLKIYHNEIKKTLSNEKLLNYFESILKPKGFNLEYW